MKHKPGKSRQVGVRMPTELADRIETAAGSLGLDASGLIRLILLEKLPEYERRARATRGEEEAGE